MEGRGPSSRALSLVALAILGALLAAHRPASAPPQEARALPGIADAVVADPREINYAYGPTEIERLQQALTNAPTATITVNYSGFSSQAQAAFQAAVDIWASLIVSPVPIRVRASFAPLGTNVLGSARAAAGCTNSKGVASTFYPAALADKINGSAYCAGLVSETHEIVASFNSTFSNWDFGTSGTPVSGKYSFLTVVMHEIGHGLGFYGSMTASGGIGTWSTNPYIYDRFAVTGSGAALLGFAKGSAALGSQLVSGNTFFSGTAATSNNGGVRPKLETSFFSAGDNGFAAGSSYSHIDDAFYTGTPNGLMTYALGLAEVYTDPGPIARGIFTDSGWGGTAPAITTQPQSQAITPGLTAVLSVVANGTNLTYQWYVGSSGTTTSPISGATASSYTTPALASTTSYWVRVSNSGGTVNSNTATVTVSGPTITTHPQNQTVAAGLPATLSVIATGPNLTYQWYVGISGTTTSPISGATGSSYFTPALISTTSYWVRVSNPGGSVNSNTATVTVSGPTITTQPQSQTIASGQSTTLSVVATGANLTHQWYVGSSGTTTSPISGATGSSYLTPQLTSPTSYWVRVSNPGGTVNSNTATVTVSEPVSVPLMSIDGPTDSAVVYQPFLTGGWAMDYRAPSGAGVDAVHVWAYPALAGGGFGEGVFVAQGMTGGLRADVGAFFGSQFNNCGFTFTVQGLPQGDYMLVVYARSTVTGTFNQDQRVRITVKTTDPVMSIDGPGEGAVVNQPFLTGGWAVDLASKSGVGVNDVHVWAYPVLNGVINPNGIFVVQGTGGGTRTDVGNFFGRQFDQSGFTFMVTGWPPGQYVLGVYCRSSVTGVFQGLFRNITVQ